jgi:hypothetical protein
MVEVIVNYTAVIVAAVVSYIVGALWYSPILFGKLWMKLSGFTKKNAEKAKKKGMTKNYIVAFIAALITAYVLAWFIGAVGGPYGTAFWIWLGFIVTTLINNVLWKGESVQLFFLNIAHYLVSLLIMAAVITAF